MVAYTRDLIARRIISEGRSVRTGTSYLNHPVISPRGIQIALATALVESNLTMYANYDDPESLKYDHDAISYDANSVGVFQQRAPWWGTAAERMDPALSAAMFYSVVRGSQDSPVGAVGDDVYGCVGGECECWCAVDGLG